MRTRRVALSLSFALCALLPTTRAAAEEVKPYVLLLVDTSASMMWPTCFDSYGAINGDNTNECPGNDLPCSGANSCNTIGCGNGQSDDTRLFKVKKGASSVINAFGEVVWGLSRFHQEPVSMNGNSACDLRVYGGAYHRGGWGGPWCGGQTIGTGGNQADVLVPLADGNQTQLLAWMNNCDDYPIAGACPFNSEPGTGSNPATPATGCSLCTDCGGGCDRELRGGGGTPIAGSLYDLRTTYLPAVIAADPKAACRPYKVILLSDGAQSTDCPGNPNTEAANLLAGLGLPGNKRVEVHVIGFGDASLKAALDGIAVAGGTTAAVIVDNEVSLALAMANIIAESVLRETCDTADNDCDGACDENWPEVGAPAGCTNQSAAQTCTAGLGICQQTGSYICKADGSGSQCSATPDLSKATTEICGNGLDDDCDGAIDEGCVPCVPQAEICNGKDDNCNGLIDEGYVSVPCGSSIGECKPGTTACVAGKVVCQGATPPTSELCDNKDNNCDTVIDSFTSVCYASSSGTSYASGCSVGTGVCVGTCQLGLSLCTAGTQGACMGAIGPVDEICNDKDDNCNGQVDEGVQNSCTNYAVGTTHCQTYQTCAACPFQPTEICNNVDDDCNGTVDDIAGVPCGSNVGECTRGTTACSGGNEICSGGKGPVAETCDGKDNDCNGKIDDAVPGMGVACGNAVGECKQGKWQCVAGKEECVGGVGPQAEICDGKDNDCDGSTDNGITTTACGSDVGECKAGTTVCQAGALICQGAVGPQPELCDGKDNDCNGVADDNPTDVGQSCGPAVGECVPGQTQCVNGAKICVGEVGPKTEVCDGLDNDCNGTVDDGVAGSGVSCGSDVGECQKGTKACQSTPSGWALVCTGSVGPQPEICDGKDNNCDGETDEDYPQKGQLCGTNVGECQSGTWTCDKTGALLCEGGTGPTPETCDGKDNDCNGAIDDNVKGEGQPCGLEEGECTFGKTKCVGAQFICVGGTQPGQEICDDKDNDCDGEKDNKAACPGASSCIEGQCVVACGTGEFNCPGGTKCINGYCIPDACSKITCKDTERCTGGKCVEKCAGRTCKATERCQPTTGQCVDDTCLSKGCPGTQVCVNYTCTDNPCGGVSCTADQMCADGKCVETCTNVTCPTGQVCQQGSCKDDPCSTIPPCPENQVCKVVDGKPRCETDPCAVIKCPPGQVCREDGCLDDPCATTTCPVYLKCEVTAKGLANCVPKAGAALPKTSKMLAAGGGGFGCAVGSDGDGGATGAGATGGSLLLLLALALLGRVRRRNGKNQS